MWVKCEGAEGPQHNTGGTAQWGVAGEFQRGALYKDAGRVYGPPRTAQHPRAGTGVQGGRGYKSQSREDLGSLLPLRGDPEGKSGGYGTTDSVLPPQFLARAPIDLTQQGARGQGAH